MNGVFLEKCNILKSDILKPFVTFCKVTGLKRCNPLENWVTSALRRKNPVGRVDLDLSNMYLQWIEMIFKEVPQNASL